MIRIDGIEFAYPAGGADTPFVLRVGAMTIPCGSHVAIVGPSGCGKTTLLHLLAGIYMPRAGQIVVNDADVTALSDDARRDFRIGRVGLVFQDFELLEYLNVEQNILLPSMINPAAPFDAAVRERAASLATSMGLGDKLRRNVRKLSQGERQRVAICRAVLMRPSLILADEPTGNLDPTAKQRTIDLLRQAATDSGATLIVVTHDHALLDEFDRVIELADESTHTEQSEAIDDHVHEGLAPAQRPRRSGWRSLAWMAWREAWDQRWRTAVLVACLAIVVFLPVAVRVMTDRANASMSARAVTTPIVMGAPGSRFDLTLHALYFRGRAPSPVSMAEVDSVRGTGWATPMPLYTAHTARGFPVVGTTLDYLTYRGLRSASGRTLRRLGDCVLGANVAEALTVGPGDDLMTDPDNVFDLAGGYPLKMRVAGVLARSGTPDDEAVFVDIRTAWIVSGLGHGHTNVVTDAARAAAGKAVVVPPGVVEYQQITDENIAAFHFHGDQSAYPVTAIIAAPHDEKSATLLSARHQDGALVALRPREVVAEMSAMVLRVRSVFDGVIAIVISATVMLVLLVIALTMRLRRREMDTLFKIGCARGTTATLHVAGLVVVVVGGILVAALALGASMPLTDAIMRMVVMS